MIERNDSGEVTYINCGIGSNFAIWAESSQPLDYEDEIFIGGTDTTARYIEKLPEIVELLKAFASWQSHGYLAEPFKKCEAIITYAEGRQDV